MQCARVRAQAGTGAPSGALPSRTAHDLLSNRFPAIYCYYAQRAREQVGAPAVSARGTALGGDVLDAADGPALAAGGAEGPARRTQSRGDARAVPYTRCKPACACCTVVCMLSCCAACSRCMRRATPTRASPRTIATARELWPMPRLCAQLPCVLQCCHARFGCNVVRRPWPLTGLLQQRSPVRLGDATVRDRTCAAPARQAA